MPRKKKQDIRVNDSSSLESLMQETYNDACNQILDAQKVINELTVSAEPEDIRGHTDIASQRTNALKIKDSAIKIKLDLAKLQNEILKHNGDIEKPLGAESHGSASVDDFSKIRDIFKKNKINAEDNGDYKLD